MTDKEIGWDGGGWQPPPRPRRVRLSGAYAVLEPLDPERHAEHLHSAYREDVEGEIWDYLPYGPFDSLPAFREWAAAAAETEDPLFFAIRDRDREQFGGVASFLRIKPESGSIEVGHINLSPSLQRTRAATESMFLMMRWAFEAGYRRYEWKCNALNRRSRRSAARLGLSYEGVFRQATISKGRNRDTAWFAAVDGEWPRLRSAFETWLSPGNFDESGGQKRSLASLTKSILSAMDPVLEEGARAPGDSARRESGVVRGRGRSPAAAEAPGRSGPAMSKALEPRPDVLDFLRTRRSRPAKTLTGPAPGRAEIGKLLRSAARSPDHGKLEPWRFIVIDRKALTRISELARARGEDLGLDPATVEKARSAFSGSPLVIAVVSSPKPSEKIPQVEQTLSAGAVCLALLNAALASGWGANWLTSWLALDREFLGTALGLEEHEFVAGFIHVGTETSVPPDRPRPDTDAITSWLDE